MEFRHPLLQSMDSLADIIGPDLTIRVGWGGFASDFDDFSLEEMHVVRECFLKDITFRNGKMVYLGQYVQDFMDACSLVTGYTKVSLLSDISKEEILKDLKEKEKKVYQSRSSVRMCRKYMGLEIAFHDITVRIVTSGIKCRFGYCRNGVWKYVRNMHLVTGMLNKIFSEKSK